MLPQQAKRQNTMLFFNRVNAQNFLKGELGNADYECEKQVLEIMSITEEALPGLQN